MFKFFPCYSDGQELVITQSDGSTEVERFYFGRQSGREGLCLTDYVRPAGDGPIDYVAMFATTVGPGVRALAERWKESGRYLDSHTLQALAIDRRKDSPSCCTNGSAPCGALARRRLERRPTTTRCWIFSGPDIAANGTPSDTRLSPIGGSGKVVQPAGRVRQHIGGAYRWVYDGPGGFGIGGVFHHPEAKYFNLDEGDIERLEAEFWNWRAESSDRRFNAKKTNTRRR